MVAGLQNVGFVAAVVGCTVVLVFCFAFTVDLMVCWVWGLWFEPVGNLIFWFSLLLDLVAAFLVDGGLVLTGGWLFSWYLCFGVCC